jgi:hypothetical protein
MASITITDGYIAANGREIVLTGSTTTLPTAIDVCDWLPGYAAGKGFRLASGKALEFVTACWWVDGAVFRIKVVLSVNAAADVFTHQAVGDFLTIDAGALQDIHGNAIAGGTVSLPNYSIIQTDGFLDPDIITNAPNVIYCVPVAGVGSDTRTLAQAKNVLTPVQTYTRALELANGAGGRWAILILEGTTQSKSGAWGSSGIDRVTPNVVGTYWHNYGAGVGSQGVRPTINAAAGQTNHNISNFVMSGLKIVAPSGAMPFWVGYSGTRRDLGWIDCEFSGAFRQFVFEQNPANPTTDKTFRPFFHRCIFGPTANRGIGVFAVGTEDILFSECATDRCGESGNSLGDVRDHAIYIASSFYHNTPAFVTRHFARRSGSHAIQLRSGGGVCGLLVDQCPIGTEMSGPGGYVRNFWMQRQQPIQTATEALPRGFGHTTKYSDTPTSNGNSPDNPVKQFPIMFELGVGSQAASGQGEEPRVIGLDFSGPQLREAVRTRNVQSRRAGPWYASGRVGDQQVPTKFGLKQSLIDGRGDLNTPSRCVFLANIAGGYGRLDMGNNCYASDTSTHAINDVGVNLASFQATTGSDAGSSFLSGGSLPTYTSDLVMLKDWFATIAGGSNDHTAAYEFYTARGLGVWTAQHDVRVAIRWLRQRQAPTNVADKGTGPLAFVGAGPSAGAFDTVYDAGAAPAIPAVPTITGEADNTVVLFTLNDQANVTQRQIRWGTASGAINLTNTINLNPGVNEHLLTGRTNGTPIYFQARATNSAGSSAWSIEQSVTPTAPPLTTSWGMTDINGNAYNVVTQPTVTIGVSLVSGDNQALSWNMANTGQTPIIIESVSMSGVGFGVDELTNATLPPNSSITFGVYLNPTFAGLHRGVLRINTSTAPLLNVAATIEFNGTGPLSQGTPETPTGGRLLPGNGRVTGLVNADGAAEFYEWFLSTNQATLSDSVYNQRIVTTVPSTESTGWVNSTPVYCRVRAGNSGGVSALTASFTATPLGDAPNPPRPRFIDQSLWTRTLSYIKEVWKPWLSGR